MSSANWNENTQQYEQYDSLVGDMVPVGSRHDDGTLVQERSDKPDYLAEIQNNCGWCHCNPCECDGFGNQPINQFNYEPERIYDVPGYERPTHTPQRERLPRS